MKADEPRQNRIPFMMSDAELAAVDEWRFANKIATRAEAIRRLVQIGLAFDAIAPDIDQKMRAVADIKATLGPDPEEGSDFDYPSPEEMMHLKAELSGCRTMLNMHLIDAIGMWQALKAGSSVEEAAATAAKSSEHTRAFAKAFFDSLPNKVIERIQTRTKK